jgi:hypothetical protein
MDPITVTVVSALAAGAAAAAKDVATSAIKDAYAALKRLILDRYKKSGPFIEAIEADPTSQPEQAVLSKQLTAAPIDPDLKQAAVAMLEAVESLKAEPRAQAMFDFGRLRALKSFQLSDLVVTGPVLHAEEATFEGDFEARRIVQSPAGGTEKK